MMFEFPFPSNGKGHSKHNCRKWAMNFTTEFPFPSNGKVDCKPEHIREYAENNFLFPFPSNGNAHRKIKNVSNCSKSLVEVSIPFKRERASQEQVTTPEVATPEVDFHSLQTGTRIARACRYYKVYAKARKMSNFFQHPLNAGRSHVGMHTALQGCRLARWRLSKVETLQGCRLARLQRKCQR